MRGLLLTFLILVFAGALVFFGRTVFHSPAADTGGLSLTAFPNLTEPRVTIIDPVRGPLEARITIIEFGDYLCEFCAEVEPVVREILAAYRDARLVWKDFPNDALHPNASRAAAAARCAGEAGKYWEYHDALFLRRSLVTSFEDLAASLSIDRDAFQGCLDSGRMIPLVQTIALEAQALRIPGVPFFFINGEPFGGTTVEAFKATIDELLVR